MDIDKIREEKLERLRSMSEQVRIGGKGTARRKGKVVHKNAAADDKKLQTALKKLNLNPIPTIEEVNMCKADGTMIHFKNPKVQASPQANVFAVTGQAETKDQWESTKLRLSKMNDGKENVDVKADEDDVPELIGDFDEKSRLE